MSLPPAITLSAYFQEYIYPLKRIINRQIPSPLMPWIRALPSLGKTLFAWTAIMMITRCSWSLMDWNRIMLSALPLKKLLNHNKRTPATELRDRRKGKIKTSVFYRGKEHEVYLSHIKVQITASRKDIYLVLIYGITEHLMMFAINKEIRSKEDVVRVARTYFSRWKIEEYFRCKNQMFQFENFRVRKLHAINALNFYITVCMAFLAMISMDPKSNALKVTIIKTANPVKEKVFFCYYRLTKGISGILSYAKEGVRLWFRTKRPKGFIPFIPAALT